MPPLPPVSAAVRPIVTVVHRPTIGETPATHAKPTASGIIARDTVSPDSALRRTEEGEAAGAGAAEAGGFGSSAGAFTTRFSALVTRASSESASRAAAECSASERSGGRGWTTGVGGVKGRARGETSRRSAMGQR